MTNPYFWSTFGSVHPRLYRATICCCDKKEAGNTYILWKKYSIDNEVKENSINRKSNTEAVEAQQRLEYCYFKSICIHITLIASAE